MSNHAGKVYILGIGDDGLEGLTRAARALLEQADLVIGSAQTLAAVGESAAERLAVDGDPEEVARQVAEQSRQARSHSGQRRSVVLWNGAIPVREAG